MTRIDSPGSVSSRPPPHGRQRIRLEPTGSGQGILDGGWWPYTVDPAEELPGLLLTIDSIRGPVTRVLLNADLCQPRPERVNVVSRTIAVGYFASQPASVLTAQCESGGRVDLLVVPPQSSWDYAAKAMWRAAQTANRVTAPYIRPRARFPAGSGHA